MKPHTMRNLIFIVLTCMSNAVHSVSPFARLGQKIASELQRQADQRERKRLFLQAASQRLTQAIAKLQATEKNFSRIANNVITDTHLVPLEGSSIHNYSNLKTKISRWVKVPRVDENGQPVRDKKGKQIIDKEPIIEYYSAAWNVDPFKAWLATDPEMYYWEPGGHSVKKTKSREPRFDPGVEIVIRNKSDIRALITLIQEEKKKIDKELKDETGKKSGLQEIMSNQLETKKAVAIARAQQAEANKGAAERVDMVFKQFRNPMYWALALGLFGGGVAAYHGIPKLIARRPEVVAEMSFLTPLEKLMGKKPPVDNAPDAILNPQTAIAVNRVSQRIKRTIAHGGELSNMLFYGPPGTGKTLVAKKLARSSGAEYMIINGAAFEQLSPAKAISELIAVFRVARTCKKPLMIFWDEAEVSLGKRGSGQETHASRRLINTFLANVSDTHHPKRMIIMATNLPTDLDDAILSRIPKEAMIYFGRPGLEERARLLRMYMHSFLNKQNMQMSDETLEHMPNFAQRLDRETGRSIRALSRNILDRMVDEDIKVLEPSLINTVIDETRANEQQMNQYVYGQS